MKHDAKGNTKYMKHNAQGNLKYMKQEIYSILVS